MIEKIIDFEMLKPDPLIQLVDPNLTLKDILMGTTQKVPNKYAEQDADAKVEEPKLDENGEVIVKQMPGSFESSGIEDGNMIVNIQ